MIQRYVGGLYYQRVERYNLYYLSVFGGRLSKISVRGGGEDTSRGSISQML